MISTLTANIIPSVTMELTARVAELRAQGLDVIAFNVGEPDFQTPQNIRDAAVRALDSGYTKYTPVPGISPLRREISSKLKNENGAAYAPQQICISTGAKQALVNTALALLNQGDEVIIPTPCWVSYIEIVKLAGGVPVFVPLSEEDGFRLDVDAIRAAVTPRTRAILINTPNNPTGAVYDRASLTELWELVSGIDDLYVISDEIYEKLIYTGEPLVSFASVHPEAPARTVTVNGFSKAYAMTGWRIGYTAAPEDIAQAISALQGHTTSNANSMAQYACVEALSGPQDSVEDMRQEFDRRRQYICERLGALPDVTCATPEGAFYVMPNVSAYYGSIFDNHPIENSIDLAAYLLDEARIAVAPGDAFMSPDHLRISYATSMENIAEGMDRMESALRKLRG